MPFWHQNLSPVERRHRLRVPAFHVDYRQTPVPYTPESQDPAEKRRSKLKPDYFWDAPCPVWKLKTYPETQATVAEEDPFSCWSTQGSVNDASDQHAAAEEAELELLRLNFESTTTTDYKRHSA